MRVVLLGSPGAGKGTQANFLTEHFNIPQISTGDILRQAIQKQTDLGKKVQAIVEAGQLVPDEIMINLIQERLKQDDCQNGFLLDGFPRTVEQAKALEKVTDIDYVVDIDVPAEVVVKRLTGRRIHPTSGRVYHLTNHPPKLPNKDDISGEPLIQREDDKEETVRKRLEVYQKQTLPLQSFYANNQENDKPKYIKIDGTHSVQDTKKTILSQLN